MSVKNNLNEFFCAVGAIPDMHFDIGYYLAMAGECVALNDHSALVTARANLLPLSSFRIKRIDQTRRTTTIRRSNTPA